MSASVFLRARWAITDFVYDHLPRARMLQRQLDQANASIERLSAMQKVVAAKPAAPTFSEAYPGHQAALDLFEWTTAMPPEAGLSAGTIDHFNDARPAMAAPHIGGFSGKTILELGPYEAYNTAQFERFGAGSVLSIEANRENFLKCLVVKNILGLRSTFLLGDMLQYLHESGSRWDVCWASGILYHMADPIKLIEGIAKVSRVAFVWTQYFDETRAKEVDVAAHLDPSRNREIDYRKRKITLHHRNYNHLGGLYFSGGNESYAYWMSKEDIMHCFAANGFRRTVMLVDNPAHPPGAAMFFLAFADD